MPDDAYPLVKCISGTLQSSLHGFRVTDQVRFAESFPIDGDFCVGVKYNPRNVRNRSRAICIIRGACKSKEDKGRGGFGNQVTIKIGGNRGSLKLFTSRTGGWTVSGTGVKGRDAMEKAMVGLCDHLNAWYERCGSERTGLCLTSNSGFCIQDHVRFTHAFPVDREITDVCFDPVADARAIWIKMGYKEKEGVRSILKLVSSGNTGTPGTGNWNLSGRGDGLVEMEDLLHERVIDWYNTCGGEVTGFLRSGDNKVSFFPEEIQISSLNFTYQIPSWVHGKKSGTNFLNHLERLGYMIKAQSKNGGRFFFCYNKHPQKQIGVCRCDYREGKKVAYLLPCTQPKRKHATKGTGQSVGDCRVLSVRLTAKGRLMIWGAKSVLQASTIALTINTIYKDFDPVVGSLGDGKSGPEQEPASSRKRKTSNAKKKKRKRKCVEETRPVIVAEPCEDIGGAILAEVVLVENRGNPGSVSASDSDSEWTP